MKKIEFTENQVKDILNNYVENGMSCNTIGKKDDTQYKKIKWVNSNIKPVDILIVDKRKDKIIKKEIV
jgi:hypothetical protein